MILLVIGLEDSIGLGKEVYLTEMPAVVRDTIVREIGQTLIEDIDRDKDDDEIVYEVDAEGDGIAIELKVAGDGSLQKKKVEEDIVLSELLPIVNKTATREVRNLWIEEVRRKTNLSGHVSYEIETRGGGKEIDLEVAADGWMLYKRLMTSTMMITMTSCGLRPNSWPNPPPPRLLTLRLTAMRRFFMNIISKGPSKADSKRKESVSPIGEFTMSNRKPSWK